MPPTGVFRRFLTAISFAFISLTLALVAGCSKSTNVDDEETDLMPLVHNTGLDSGDVAYVDGNPLSQYSIEVLIPTLEFRGVTVPR